MFAWILALVLAVAVWTAATCYLWLVRRRDDETQAGLTELAGLRWRDFSEIVRRALNDQRGWQADTQLQDDGTPRADFLMHDDQDRRWMVSCKHGRAYRIGAAAVNELASATRLAGAQGGLLLTEGKVEREGLALAEKQAIEILDGRRIWPILKPYLPSESESRIVDGARHRAQRHIAIAALASVTLGLLVGLGYLSSRPFEQAPEPSPLQAATPAGPTAAPAAPAAPPSVPAASAPAASAPVSAAALATGDAGLDPDPATLDRYQQAVSRALAGAPGITRGIWLTRMTLAVDRQGDDAQVWPRICEELERYPVLRTVRVQLNPRPGVAEPVRWRQCSTI
jgi:hypothetical protein